MTVSYWESVDAMASFTGAEPTVLRHLDRDVEFLIELPTSVQIFELRKSYGRVGGGPRQSATPIGTGVGGAARLASSFSGVTWAAIKIALEELPSSPCGDALRRVALVQLIAATRASAHAA
jgi:hypothetical protein